MYWAVVMSCCRRVLSFSRACKRLCSRTPTCTSIATISLLIRATALLMLTSGAGNKRTVNHNVSGFFSWTSKTGPSWITRSPARRRRQTNSNVPPCFRNNCNTTSTLTAICHARSSLLHLLFNAFKLLCNNRKISRPLSHSSAYIAVPFRYRWQFVLKRNSLSVEKYCLKMEISIPCIFRITC